MMNFNVVYLLISFISSGWLTGAIYRYALRRKLLDVPNQRSSHTQPTPRGGGLAMVLAFFAVCLLLYAQQQLSGLRLALCACALPVAIIGFVDDHRPVSAKWRFLVHLLSAGSILYGLGGLPVLSWAYHAFKLGLAGYVFGGILLVWLLNLFNFMDGTDGIAASESLFVSGVLAFFLHAIDPELSLLAFCIAAVSGGFLVWNFPPAKIFMGDVGSGFLGLMLGLLILLSAQQAGVLLFCGLIAFAVFIADATYTLCYRYISGQQWYAAHCSHTYQRAAKRYGHLKVLIAVWLINLFWLCPIAYWIFRHPQHSLIALIISYLPLFALAYRFKAGQVVA